MYQHLGIAKKPKLYNFLTESESNNNLKIHYFPKKQKSSVEPELTDIAIQEKKPGGEAHLLLITEGSGFF